MAICKMIHLWTLFSSISSNVLPRPYVLLNSNRDLISKKIVRVGRVIKTLVIKTLVKTESSRLDLFNQALHVFESRRPGRLEERDRLEAGNRVHSYVMHEPTGNCHPEFDLAIEI